MTSYHYPQAVQVKSSVKFHKPSISGDQSKPKETKVCIEKYMSCNWKP